MSRDWVVILLLLALFLTGSGSGSEGMRPAGPALQAPGVGAGRDLGADAAYLAGRHIAIDPGHGGIDGGTRGVGPLPEKTVVLRTGLYLRDLLRAAGASVYMTRENDVLPGGSPTRTLAARTQAVRTAGAEVLISLHADASPDPAARGITTYYHDGDEAELARRIHAALVEALNAHDLGVRPAGFYVLRDSSVPTVLVELGFLSNPTEAATLGGSDYQYRAARAIARGLAGYFAETAPARRGGVEGLRP